MIEYPNITETIDIHEPNLSKAGATAYAAGNIWSIDQGYLGPHGWDVRAAVVTPQLVKVLYID